MYMLRETMHLCTVNHEMVRISHDVLTITRTMQIHMNCVFPGIIFLTKNRTNLIQHEFHDLRYIYDETV